MKLFHQDLSLYIIKTFIRLKVILMKIAIQSHLITKTLIQIIDFLEQILGITLLELYMDLRVFLTLKNKKLK